MTEQGRISGMTAESCLFIENFKSHTQGRVYVPEMSTSNYLVIIIYLRSSRGSFFGVTNFLQNKKFKSLQNRFIVKIM